MITPKKIIDTACFVLGVSPEQFIGKSNVMKLSDARKIAILLMRNLTHTQYSEISVVTGRKINTCFIQMQNAKRLLVYNPEFKKKVDRVTELLNHD